MDSTLDSAWASLQTGWAQISALLVSYSFSVLGALVLIIGGWILAGLIERWLYAGLARIRGFDRTLRGFFASLGRYAIIVLVLVMVLGQFGVQTASIIAAIGAIGLAIGLALQGTLQNIAAGIMLLVLRPFRVGESIAVGNIDGDVEEIGLFATRLRQPDGVYVLAPNSKLWNEPVRNSSRNRLRRNDITIGLDYATDVDAAEEILLGLAGLDERVKSSPAPQVFVGELRDTLFTMTLRYWTSDTDFLKTKTALNRLIKQSFDRQAVRPAVAPQPLALAPRAGSEQADAGHAPPARAAVAARK
ncbi:MAG: mechanosensitive ion channel family protein [Rhizobiaceae bacterium]|nr:mechanosensitive ion channel family protein [Rhizobiaceae bacterium]